MISRECKEFLNSIFDIDVKAGEWLMNNKIHKETELRGRSLYGKLNHLFIWDESPQGHTYWYNIYLILERKYG